VSPSSVVGSLTAGVSTHIAEASFLPASLLMVVVIVVPVTFYGVMRHREIAPPKSELPSACRNMR